MNLNLSPPANPPVNENGTKVVENTQHNHVLENEGGTQIDGINESSKNTCQFRIIECIQHTQSLNFKVFKESYTIYIGRNPEGKSQAFNKDKDIAWVLNDPYASRAQCLIDMQKNRVQFILQDLGSANGTKINGSSLDKDDQILLNVGDKIEIGDTVFIFENQ